ncbi:hypothetical protein [Vibrio scophthalmi]|uniref:Uncharacterized protein n=1 Tax=Vibrio scophthalmi TaxID=45658 RepID=A0A1C7F8Q9_9VIBR|nr:hypothetical protein [Vibrio scophthalmi]ANU36271.1 hypothetical protein VSVS05_01144 [Vibrio scophthalmi]
MYTKAITLALTLALTACQSTTSENYEVAISAQDLNKENVKSLIEQTSKVNLAEDDFQGNVQYLDQVYYSVAKQMVELVTKPHHLSLPVVLTTQMYDGDAGGFFVVLDSQWLIEQGAIEDNLDVAVFSTNNLWNSDYSDSVDRATYNRLILGGIAVAGIDAPYSKKQKMLLDLPLNMQKIGVQPNFYMEDKVENIEGFGELIINHSIHYGKFDYRDYYGSTRARTKKAVFFIQAEAEEARNLVGQQYHIVFMPGAVFEIEKTGQLVVVALQQYSMLTDPNNRPLTHSLFDAKPFYVWYGSDFEKDFTSKRTERFIYEDNGSSQVKL